jgi:hypothetical protein
VHDLTALSLTAVTLSALLLFSCDEQPAGSSLHTAPNAEGRTTLDEPDAQFQATAEATASQAATEATTGQDATGKVESGDAAASVVSAPVAFERQVLSAEFVAEGAAFCDVDRDGHEDVVAGAQWYRGPEFLELTAFRPKQAFDPVAYSDAFATYCYDFDGDAWNDVLIFGFPGADASWFRNPQTAGAEWSRSVVFEPLDNEAASWVDLDADGTPEIVMNSAGYFGWAGPALMDPAQPFLFHPISPLGTWGAFTHGLGVGDIDGDGRSDVLDAQGYWRQPETSSDEPWSHQAVDFGEGGAQMFALDVDGDGDKDVITSLQAHGYGVAWFEQLEGAAGFAQHTISPIPDAALSGDVVLHEPHALALVDVDADGLLDVLTGERFWGHAPPEAERDLAAPALLVWFRLTRDAEGVHFTPYVIDDQSGVGVQVVAKPLDDGRLAVLVANKKGVFVFRASTPMNASAESL